MEGFQYVPVTSRDLTSSQVQRRIFSNLSPSLVKTRLCGFVCGKSQQLLKEVRPLSFALAGQKIAPWESFQRCGLPIQRAPYCAMVDSVEYFIWTYSRWQHCTKAEIPCMNKLLANCAVTGCRTSHRTDYPTEKTCGQS